jgi:hypothetical protein
MFWLKCCPRCGGDLYGNRDRYGYYIACVQCGRYLTEAEEALLKYAAWPRPPANSKKNLVRGKVGAARAA